MVNIRSKVRRPGKYQMYVRYVLRRMKAPVASKFIMARQLGLCEVCSMLGEGKVRGQ